MVINLKEVNMRLKTNNFMHLILVIFLYVCQACGSEVTLDEALASPQKNISRNKELLGVAPTRAGTVGSILVAQKEDKLYMLLARESINPPAGKENDPKWIAKKGTFSDLGGSTDGDVTKTFLEHIQRELQEESMGMFQLKDASILKDALVIHKVSAKQDRDIIYIIYLVKPEEFISQQALNARRDNAASTLGEESLEKDLFVWCEVTPFLKERVAEELKVNDWNGDTHTIKLRKFFIQDALTEDFRKIINLLQSRSLKE
jgi:hypothetical protein